MKIIIINGSPRKNGGTAYALHELEKYLKAQGAEVLFYDLINQKMEICTGCGVCYNLGRCVFDDDAERLSNLIGDSDGIIIGSSTMESNVSGLLKIFMDRGHFVIEQLLKGKYAAGVVTYENYGGTQAAKIIKNLLILSGAKSSAMICEKLEFNSEYALNSALKAKVENAAVRICHDIKFQKNYRLQGLVHSVLFNVGIKPFVMKKGKAYAGVQNRWKAIGLL